jgi:hypothetical protein
VLGLLRLAPQVGVGGALFERGDLPLLLGQVKGALGRC